MNRFTTSGQDKKGPRLFIDVDLVAGNSVQTDQSQAHYLRDVMRLRIDDTVLLFNGRDGEWLAKVSNLSRRSLDLLVVEQTKAQTDPGDIWFMFAPLKRGRLDYIVQKATELGASYIQPVQTRYTNSSKIKADRLQANIVEAAEQCGVLSVPELGNIEKISSLLDTWDPARRIIFCDENATISNPILALSNIAPGPLALLIGPEGGFADEERDRLMKLGFVTAISLGPRILRADTAGVAAMSLVQAVCGDWTTD